MTGIEDIVPMLASGIIADMVCRGILLHEAACPVKMFTGWSTSAGSDKVNPESAIRFAMSANGRIADVSVA